MVFQNYALYPHMRVFDNRASLALHGGVFKASTIYWESVLAGKSAGRMSSRRIPRRAR
jgi:ABC-type Fe3+/spermidine/putrescine transport system ATPase subunit